MNDLMAKVLERSAAGEHRQVVDLVEGVAVEGLHYKALFVVGQSHIALAQPGKALPYLVRSFFLSPTQKKLVQIRKLAQSTGDLSLMPGIVDFVFDHHAEDLELISFLAPFLPEVDGDTGASGKAGLIDFYALAERGRSREAVVVGRRLMREGATSPALAARLADLLLILGETAEAMTLVTPAAPPADDWRAGLSTIVRARGFTPSLIVICDVTALGDFLQRLTIASKIKSNCPTCHITFCYRADRGFKTDLIRCALGIDKFVALDDLSPAAVEAAIGSQTFRRAVILETDSSFFFAAGAYQGEPWLRIPDEDVAALSEELAALGVDPNRWFVTTHYRQGNSAPTPHLEPLRDVQSGNFHDVAAHIIDDMGGQVLRLGHPGMDKLPPRPGYIDLSEASIALQLFATSRSRFMMGTDSGMVSFAIAFAIPTGRTNVTYDIAQENPADIILLKNLISLDGFAISTAHQFRDENGIALFRLPIGGDFKIYDNIPQQLRVVADALFEKTADVEGWREPPTPTSLDDKAGGPFPMNWRRTATVLDLAEMIGLPVRPL
jgi:putative glycosyltransferase (TIGR04372 family)